MSRHYPSSSSRSQAANNIRKLFNLTKEDDVRKFVIRRKIEKEGKKPYTKAPRIQRLVTPERLQRKRSE